MYLGKTVPEWQLIAKNFADPGALYWNERQVLDRLHEIEVPVYYYGGLRADGFVNLDVFSELDRNSQNKEKHHLILGFWNHSQAMPHTASGLDLPEFMRVRLPSILASELKGTPSPFAGEKRVQIASNLHSDFLGFDEQPWDSLAKETLFLNERDGALTLDETQNSQTDSSTYFDRPLEINVDPSSDQNLNFAFKATHDIPILGRMIADLYITIDVPQTDVFLSLEPSLEAGHSYFHDFSGGHRLFNGQEVNHVHIVSDPGMSVLKRGEGLTLNLSSNQFPRRLRNTNMPVEQFYDGYRNAKITVLHSAQYPSRIRFDIETP
jgi:predicted acyl esterase